MSVRSDAEALAVTIQPLLRSKPVQCWTLADLCEVILQDQVTIPAVQADYLAAQFDSVVTALAPIAALSANVVAGSKYLFELLALTTLDAVGLGKFDLAGGTCTATRADWTALIGLAAGSVACRAGNGSALNSSLSLAGATTSWVYATGSLACSGSGTLVPQFGQAAGPNGTSSVLVGSFFRVTRVP